MQLSQTPRIHPLIAAAAASIILVCMLGVAVLAYSLPFRKDGAGGVASLLARTASPAAPAVQLPTGAVTPAASGSSAPVTVTALAPGRAVPGSQEADLSATPAAPAAAAAFDMPMAPAQGTVAPAVNATEPTATKPALRRPGAAPAAAAEGGLQPAASAKSGAPVTVHLEAARRATAALASGRIGPSGSNQRGDDSAPAKLRPDQLEAARRATALLAQAAQATQAGTDARAAAPMTQEQSKTAREPAR